MEDIEIVELFFKRSDDAIRELDTKYGHVFRKLSYNILNDWRDVEECVNDAYLGVWSVIPPERPNPLLAYVCKIARNLSLKALRKNKSAKRNSDYTVSLEEIEPFLPGRNRVENEIEYKELAHLIEEFLDQQTVENRVIFMRRYWFSDSYKDIAERMCLSEKIVSVRLTRLRKKLRDYLIQGGSI